MKVSPPSGAEAIAPRPLTLDEVPGAQLVYHAAWELPADGRLMVACAERHVPLWVDGLYDAVLGGMNGLVVRHLGLPSMRPAQVIVESDHRLQPFEGDDVQGVQVVGFSQTDTLLACSVACRGSEATCDAALRGLEVDPVFVKREATGIERAMSATLQHPRTTVLVVIALLLVGVAVLLWRRPSEDALATRRKERA